MKNFLLILGLIVVVSHHSNAQGNLQFNQVINITFTGTGSTLGQSIGTVTVPAGKVLKVERTSLSEDNGSLIMYPVYSSSYYVYIGDFVVWSSTNSYSPKLFPLWLSAGTYDVRARTYGSSDYNFAISAIEFNVIP